MMSIKVLIIDDERIIRRTTSLLLEKSGIDVMRGEWYGWSHIGRKRTTAYNSFGYHDVGMGG